jgi:hypothetical protein
MQGIKDEFPHLPEKISGLRELAYNLWWSWHPEGRALFQAPQSSGLVSEQQQSVENDQ